MQDTHKNPPCNGKCWTAQDDLRMSQREIVVLTEQGNFQQNVNLSQIVFSHRNQLFQLESSGNRGFNINPVLFDKVETDRKTEEKNRALNKTVFFFFFLF